MKRGGDWLRLAERDLISTRRLLPDLQLAAQAAFLAQQCAERCLKGVISIEDNTVPPRLHDLKKLRERIRDLGPQELSLLASAESPTPYAVEMRDAEPDSVTAADAEAAIQLAAAVLRWARERLAAV